MFFSLIYSKDGAEKYIYLPHRRRKKLQLYPLSRFILFLLKCLVYSLEEKQQAQSFQKQCIQMRKGLSVAKVVPMELGRNVLKHCKLLEKVKPNVTFYITSIVSKILVSWYSICKSQELFQL